MPGPPWRVNLLALGGLVLALLLAGLAKLREGYRVRGRLLIFTLFLLLESPTLVYAGILGGTLGGIYWVSLLGSALSQLNDLFLPTLGGGAIAGLIFGSLRQVRPSPDAHRLDSGPRRRPGRRIALLVRHVRALRKHTISKNKPSSPCRSF